MKRALLLIAVLLLLFGAAGHAQTRPTDKQTPPPPESRAVPAAPTPKTVPPTPATTTPAAAPAATTPTPPSIQAETPAPVFRPSELRGDVNPIPFTPKGADEPVIKPLEAGSDKPEDSKKWCDLFISKTDPRDMLMFDQTGTYMDNVRQIYMWVPIGAKTPSVRIYMWKGIYKPSDPRQIEWPVRQIRVVDDNEFQKLVDQHASK